MRSALCSRIALCQLRRFEAAVRATPLLAPLSVLVVLVAPFVLFRVGRAVGTEFVAGPALDEGVAKALVLGPVLAGAAAGTALAASLPHRSALGEQIAVAPFGRVVGVVAVMLVPVVAGTVALVPSLVAGCLGVSSGLSRGPLPGIALACAVVTAVPAGALLAEAGISIARRCYRRGLEILVVAPAWALAGWALGAPALGPLAPVATGLRGTGHSSLAFATSASVAVALALLWVALAATRPAPRSAVRRRSPKLVPEGPRAVPAAVAALVARRGEIRISAGGAVLFGVVGVGIAATTAPPPAAFLLGATTALTGAFLAPLMTCGVLMPGHWLWRGGSSDMRAVTRAALVTGVAGAVLPAALVGAFAAGVSGTSPGAVGVVALLAIVGASVALAAGGLIPWTGSGVADQFTTIAAFVGAAVAMSLAVALVAPRLVAVGVPDVLVALLVVAAAGRAALVAIGRRLGSDAR